MNEWNEWMKLMNEMNGGEGRVSILSLRSEHKAITSFLFTKVKE